MEDNSECNYIMNNLEMHLISFKANTMLKTNVRGLGYYSVITSVVLVRLLRMNYSFVIDSCFRIIIKSLDHVDTKCLKSSLCFNFKATNDDFGCTQGMFVVFFYFPASIFKPHSAIFVGKIYKAN